MSEAEFTRLFKYMSERFDSIDKSLKEKASKADMHRLIGLIDALAKRVEISEDERLVRGYQLSRLDRWAHELAGKIGYKLSV